MGWNVICCIKYDLVKKSFFSILKLSRLGESAHDFCSLACLPQGLILSMLNLPHSAFFTTAEECLSYYRKICNSLVLLGLCS